METLKARLSQRESSIRAREYTEMDDSVNALRKYHKQYNDAIDEICQLLMKKFEGLKSSLDSGEISTNTMWHCSRVVHFFLRNHPEIINPYLDRERIAKVLSDLPAYAG